MPCLNGAHLLVSATPRRGSRRQLVAVQSPPHGEKISPWRRAASTASALIRSSRRGGLATSRRRVASVRLLRRPASRYLHLHRPTSTRTLRDDKPAGNKEIWTWSHWIPPFALDHYVVPEHPYLPACMTSRLCRSGRAGAYNMYVLCSSASGLADIVRGPTMSGATQSSCACLRLQGMTDLAVNPGLV